MGGAGWKEGKEEGCFAEFIVCAAGNFGAFHLLKKKKKSKWNHQGLGPVVRGFQNEI